MNAKNLPFLCRTLATAFEIVCFASALSAQVANNTALVGNVVDPTGSPVAGATVTAVNTGTAVVYHGTTNGEGFYSIGFISPGTYDISVEETGFATIKKTG